MGICEGSHCSSGRDTAVAEDRKADSLSPEIQMCDCLQLKSVQVSSPHRLADQCSNPVVLKVGASGPWGGGVDLS